VASLEHEAGHAESNRKMAAWTAQIAGSWQRRSVDWK
jgi:hypothetical protein